MSPPDIALRVVAPHNSPESSCSGQPSPPSNQIVPSHQVARCLAGSLLEDSAHDLWQIAVSLRTLRCDNLASRIPRLEAVEWTLKCLDELIHSELKDLLTRRFIPWSGEHSGAYEALRRRIFCSIIATSCGATATISNNGLSHGTYLEHFVFLSSERAILIFTDDKKHTVYHEIKILDLPNLKEQYGIDLDLGPLSTPLQDFERDHSISKSLSNYAFFGIDISCSSDPLGDLFELNTSQEPYGPACFRISNKPLLLTIINDMKGVFPIQDLKHLETGMALTVAVMVLRLWLSSKNDNHDLNIVLYQLGRFCKGMTMIQDDEEGYRLLVDRQPEPCFEHRLLRQWCLYTLSPVKLRVNDHGYVSTRGPKLLEALFLWITKPEPHQARFWFLQRDCPDVFTVDLQYAGLCYVDLIIFRDSYCFEQCPVSLVSGLWTRARLETRQGKWELIDQDVCMVDTVNAELMPSWTQS